MLQDEGDEMQHHLLELPKDAELGGEMMPLARLLTGGSEPCANTTETGAVFGAVFVFFSAFF